MRLGAAGIGQLVEHAGDVAAVDDRAVAAELHRGIDGAPGGAHQHAELLTVVGVAGHTERDRQRQGVLCEAAARRAAQPLGDQEGAVLVGLGQQHGELLAADPPGRVDPPLPLRHVLADLLERHVARAVPALRVQPRHAVDLADDHPQRPPGAARAVDLEVEQFLERASVEQTRQGVEPTRGSDALRELRDLPPLIQDHDQKSKRPGGEDE